ncbi:hypothetical protein T4D_14150 [Trichinella pseudospiralis]|uniref:Uncharacterized protein n=1 Tax=Trichinella pseudospiralis TaxID=6337 RepID=A0A0V1FP68_TRIPS|nr:hypothetical protein T4D_14150 [Trichinella pseudospiralis]
MALCEVLNLQVELCLTFFARCKYTVHITSIPSPSRVQHARFHEHFMLYKFLLVACKMCQEMNCMRLYDRMSIRVAVSSSSGLSHFVARIFCSQTDDSGNKAVQPTTVQQCQIGMELFLSACRITAEYQ